MTILSEYWHKHLPLSRVEITSYGLPDRRHYATVAEITAVEHDVIDILAAQPTPNVWACENGLSTLNDAMVAGIPWLKATCTAGQILCEMVNAGVLERLDHTRLDTSSQQPTGYRLSNTPLPRPADDRSNRAVLKTVNRLFPCGRYEVSKHHGRPLNATIALAMGYPNNPGVRAAVSSMAMRESWKTVRPTPNSPTAACDWVFPWCR